MIYAFPNPADNKVTFQYSLEKLSPNTSIHVFDIKGRKVKELVIDKKQDFIEWHTNQVRAGLYFYSIAKGKHILGSGQVMITH